MVDSLKGTEGFIEKMATVFESATDVRPIEERMSCPQAQRFGQSLGQWRATVLRNLQIRDSRLFSIKAVSTLYLHQSSSGIFCLSVAPPLAFVPLLWFGLTWRLVEKRTRTGKEI